MILFETKCYGFVSPGVERSDKVKRGKFFQIPHPFDAFIRLQKEEETVLSFYLTMLEDSEDQRLFDETYLQHYRRMMAAALSVIPSRPKAEDAVHDAFLKLIVHFDAFKAIPEEKRARWLTTVTRNTAVDLLRREGREVAVEEARSAQEEAAPDDGEFLRLVELIRAMPETYRQPLELRFVSEWSLTEIAEELHVSLGTVKARIYRGRRILMDHMRKEGYR